MTEPNNHRIVFEIDREHGELPIFLLAGVRSRRLAVCTIAAVVAAVVLLGVVHYFVGTVVLAALIALDAYYPIDNLWIRRLRGDVFYIEDAVLVCRRPPQRVLRIPLNELDGVGVQRLLGGRRIVVLLRGDKVYECTGTVERADAVARRIMQEAGLPRVAKFDRVLPVSIRIPGDALLIGLILIIGAAAYPAFERFGWIAVAPAAALIAWLLVVLLRRWGDPRADIWYCCRNCLYDLRGITDDRCPECGEYQ